MILVQGAIGAEYRDVAPSCNPIFQAEERPLPSFEQVGYRPSETFAVVLYAEMVSLTVHRFI